MKREDFDELKQLVDFLLEKRVTEFDLNRGDVRIRLRFGKRDWPVEKVILPPNPQDVPPED